MDKSEIEAADLLMRTALYGPGGEPAKHAAERFVSEYAPRLLALAEAHEKMQRVVDAAKKLYDDCENQEAILDLERAVEALSALDNPKVDPIAGSYEFAERLRKDES